MNLFMHRVAKGALFASVGLAAFAMIGCKHTSDSVSGTSIIGGVNAPEYPFMAGVVNQRRSPGTASCGGSLIRKNVILTAAHCVARSTSSIYGYMGSTSIKEGLRTLVPAEAILVHPDYDTNFIENDLALIFLKDYEPTRFAGPVAPIALATTQGTPQPGDQITLIGWGLMTSIGRLKDDALKQLAMPVLPDSACKQVYDNFEDAAHTRFCYNNAAEGGGDACNGDSGGPLVSIGPDGPRLVGTVSYGRGICGQKGNPGVATRVAAYADWINTNADYYTRPITQLDGKLLADMIQTHCKDRLMMEESDDRGQTRFTIYHYFSPQPMTATQAFAANPAQKEVASCEFSLQVGGASQAIVVSVVAGGGEQHFDVQAGEQKYSGAVREILGLEINSREDSTIVAQIDSPTDFSNYVVAHGITYAIREELTNIPDKFTSIANCATAAYSAAVLAGEGETRMLQLKGPVWPKGGKLIHLLPMGNSTTDLKLVFTPKDALHGTLQLKNDSSMDLYSWKLDCSFGFSLTDQSGKTYEPRMERGPGPSGYSQDLYYHLFDMTQAAAGTILKNNAATFSYVQQAPLGKYEPIFCTLNGNSISVTFPRDSLPGK